MLYFKYLSHLYRDKKNGLLYDNVPSHCSKAVSDQVKASNNKPKNICTFVIEFVDPYLTSIYQSPDAIYNEPFKALIQEMRNESISTGLTSGNLNIGDKNKVSRDDLINFI